MWAATRGQEHNGAGAVSSCHSTKQDGPSFSSRRSQPRCTCSTTTRAWQRRPQRKTGAKLAQGARYGAEALPVGAQTARAGTSPRAAAGRPQASSRRSLLRLLQQGGIGHAATVAQKAGQSGWQSCWSQGPVTEVGLLWTFHSAGFRSRGVTARLRGRAPASAAASAPTLERHPSPNTAVPAY